MEKEVIKVKVFVAEDKSIGVEFDKSLPNNFVGELIKAAYEQGLVQLALDQKTENENKD